MSRSSTVSKYGSLGNYMGMKIAKRNTFLIDPEGKIAKVWTGVDPSNPQHGSSGGAGPTWKKKKRIDAAGRVQTQKKARRDAGLFCLPRTTIALLLLCCLLSGPSWWTSSLPLFLVAFLADFFADFFFAAFFTAN